MFKFRMRSVSANREASAASPRMGPCWGMFSNPAYLSQVSNVAFGTIVNSRRSGEQIRRFAFLKGEIQITAAKLLQRERKYLDCIGFGTHRTPRDLTHQ